MSGPLPPPQQATPRGLGLSGKLMLLTVAFVVLAEVLIFVPSIANFRNNWLRDRLAVAQTAALVIEAAPAEAIPETLVERLLDTVGARLIAMKIGGTRRLIAANETPPDVNVEFDMRNNPWPDAIFESFGTLASGGARMMRVVGPSAMGGEFLEIVMPERPLRDAMLRFARNIMLITLLISTITASLVYASLHSLIVRPVKRLAENFADFGKDTARVIEPSDRRDELGDAERRLSEMQRALNQQIKQQQRLAGLGLAVAKINHDLRNLLSSAQLLSDRIASVADPTVQRVAPKLVIALDRAVAFCQGTLAFGKADERPPSPRKFDLNTLVLDLRDLLALGEPGAIAFDIQMPQPMFIRADSEHLLRVLMNLSRNSLESMQPQWKSGQPACLTIEAKRTESGTEIDVKDNGPGIPAELKARLFQPFSASRRAGSTGLGLAIALELMQAQGGQIRLVEQQKGTCFRLTLPL